MYMGCIVSKKYDNCGIMMHKIRYSRCSYIDDDADWLSIDSDTELLVEFNDYVIIDTNMNEKDEI